MSTKHALFEFHNAFDQTRVLFDDASVDASGPFEVSLIFDAPEISTEGESFKFEKGQYAQARAKFLELVNSEFDAVLGEMVGKT